jgi:hypothetical protein
MGWVEQLKPDDEVKVEFIYPQAYVEYSMSTIRNFSRGISYLCKGEAVLGENEADFIVWDMTVLQISVLEEVFRKFGVEMTHECGAVAGRRYVWIYADLTGLKERMDEDGEFDFEEEWE